MKPMISIPILAVALVTVSAASTPASACAPKPGQCCSGEMFSENGKTCRITSCAGEGKFFTVDTKKQCWFSVPDVRIDNPTVSIPRPPLLSGSLGAHLIPGGSGGSTHR
jgi:hypothetical protein